MFRVCAWSADDFGMEYDSADYNKIINLFNLIIKERYVSIEFLKTLGFTTA